MAEHIVGTVLTALGVAFARKFRALDTRGVVVALALAATLLVSDARLLLLMMIFFFTSSALTLLGYEAKERKGASERRGGRSATQVLCSGAIPATLAALSLVAPSHVKQPLRLAAATSIACANADTWASEIGSLSRSPPMLVTNPRIKVPAGVSGGVTWLGELGAVTGSAVIAALSILLAVADPLRATLILVLGWIGELLDAILGALLQAKYECTKCGVLSDREVHVCGAEARRAGGISFLKNEFVNLISELAVAFLSLALTSPYP